MSCEDLTDLAATPRNDDLHETVVGEGTRSVQGAREGGDGAEDGTVTGSSALGLSLAARPLRRFVAAQDGREARVPRHRLAAARILST
jgi:hypothetical protein